MLLLAARHRRRRRRARARFISQNQIKERGQSNRGMAIAGLATGAAAVALGSST
jgi:hypothetical protein